MAVAGMATGTATARPVAAQAAGAAAPAVQAPTTNVQVSQDAGLLSAEDTPTLARNPAQPSNMVMVDRTDRPDFSAPVRYSDDSGTTWHLSQLQVPPESDFQGGLALVPHKLYAPRAVYAGDGTLYVSFVTLSGPGNDPDGVWIERSKDGGQSFLPPSPVAGPYAFQTDLAIDRGSGRLFMTWLAPPIFLCVLCFPDTGYPIVVTHSDDGGATWSSPVHVSDPGRARIGSPVLAVDAHGNPSVLYYDYEGDTLDWQSLPGTYTGNFTLVVTSSADRGVTFGPGRVVDSSIVPPHRFLVYLAPVPGLAISSSGEMVAVWPDGRSGSGQVLERSSTDGGSSWQGPVVVNPSTADGQDQDLPAVAIAPDGRVDVAYYDASGSSASVWLSSSADGGATFPTAVQISTASSDTQVGPQESPFYLQADFGSKMSLLSYDDRALAAWTDSRKGNASTGKQDIYLAAVPVTPPAGVSAVVIGLAVAAAALAVAGGALLVTSRRRSRGTRPPGGRAAPGVNEMPPPPPPLVPSPGQV
ncbi:MAG: sialidase family protein [Acidimicrobiales bacterium]